MLLIDKPEGPTSHDVVDRVRHALGVRRAGHTGTLDPLASGLLVVLTGRATRLAQFLVGLDKEYEGVIRLGETTTTDDRGGVVTARSEAWRHIADEDLRSAMRALEGTYEQRPPAFSAKKIGGERAHRAARRGERPDVAPVTVRVHRFSLRGRRGPELDFEGRVGSGTYIRALARDLGDALGCGAHLGSLRRTAVGPFHVRDALPLDALDARVPLLAPRAAVGHLPHVVADPVTAEHLRHGRTAELPGGPEGPVAVLEGERLLAVAEGGEGRLRPRVVLAS